MFPAGASTRLLSCGLCRPWQSSRGDAAGRSLGLPDPPVIQMHVKRGRWGVVHAALRWARDRQQPAPLASVEVIFGAP